MDIKITTKHRSVDKGHFNYSNIESSFGVNTQYFTKNEEPFMMVTGEIHFSRLPKYRWRETLLKMKALGLNAISTYVFWNYHEEIKSEFDWSENKSVSDFLTICKELDLPVILRIGPWCHGEVVYGGFPKRIVRMKKIRTNDKKYLKEVYEYWEGVYKEVKPFLDGETIIGIQLENEYSGPVTHLKELRKIAEEIGFKTPFFTMTAWPTGIPDNDFLPMFGGYPDAPWTHGKKALKPNNRFAILPGKSAEEIGTDLIENNEIDEHSFKNIPYATCEIGSGVQPTQHRRPLINAKDGYGVGFAKLASGVNLQGYYMFVGGSNPNYKPMQESKKTGYPNNYPIIDYDFQAPISKYGDVREHGHMLRLLHLFATQFDEKFCTKQAFFPKWPSMDSNDVSFPRCSVRMDENESGYVFLNSYEKAIKFDDFKDVNVTIQTLNNTIYLPKIDVKAESMFFYPFNIIIGNNKFDYILAQPIAKEEKSNKIVCYFQEISGVIPYCVTNGKKIELPIDKDGILIDNVRIIVLPTEVAKTLYCFNDKVYFNDGNVWKDDNIIWCEKRTNDITDKFTLKKCNKKKLPYDYYLYSRGKRVYYELELPKNIIEDYYDIELHFDFEGLNLQVFSGDTIINDYFNIDKNFVMRLRDYKEYLNRNNKLTIKVVPKTKFGISNVFNDVEIPLYSNKLTLISAKQIVIKSIKS